MTNPVASLAALLRPYLKHKLTCAIGKMEFAPPKRWPDPSTLESCNLPCDCGFDAALAELEARGVQYAPRDATCIYCGDPYHGANPREYCVKLASTRNHNFVAPSANAPDGSLCAACGKQHVFPDQWTPDHQNPARGRPEGPSAPPQKLLRELAEAAQGYLNSQEMVGHTEESRRALRYRLGCLIGPHLVAQQAGTPEGTP